MTPDIDRAAEMAYRCLLAHGCSQLPVDPARIIRCTRGVTLYTYEQAAEALGVDVSVLERSAGGLDACTFRGEMKEGEVRYLVCFRTGGNPARLRFTLAHELAHIVMGHQGAGAGEEREADAFAQHLLCPRPVLRWLMARCSPLYAEQVAAVCYVSVACAQQLASQAPACVQDEVEEQVGEMMKETLRNCVVPSLKMPAWHVLDLRQALPKSEHF